MAFSKPTPENIKVARQQAIRAMEIGDTISESRRIDMSFGVTPEEIRRHKDALRSSLDQQAIRARRANRPADYTVEMVTGVSQLGALVLTALVTRVR